MSLLTMLKSIKTTIFLSVVIVGSVAAVVSYPLYAAEGDTEEVHVIRDQVSESEALYPSWVSDDEFLTGAADNVFVGRVLRAEDTVTTSAPSEDPPLPLSRFSVEVLENVKGNLSNEVTVAQDSGWIEYYADKDYPNQQIEKGEKVRELVLTNENPLLKPEEQYLFITSYNQEYDRYHVLASRLGSKKIRGDKQQEKLVDHFEKAKRQQKNPDKIFAK